MRQYTVIATQARASADWHIMVEDTEPSKGEPRTFIARCASPKYAIAAALSEVINSASPEVHAGTVQGVRSRLVEVRRP